MSLLVVFLSLGAPWGEPFPSGVEASASSAPMPFHKSKLHRLLHSRCHSPLHHASLNLNQHDDDGGNSAIWSWEGKLTDPATGQLICNVEGIELVRLLSECPSPPSLTKGGKSRTRELYSTIRGLRRLDDLRVRSLLSSKSSKATNVTDAVDWNYAGTILSRKLFVYSTPPHNSEQPDAPYSPSSSPPSSATTLLTSFRKGPTAPVTYIPMDQRVTFYDTATTYVSTDGGKGMQVFTEWSDGRWVQSEAKAHGFQSSSIDTLANDSQRKMESEKESSPKRNKEESMDFTVFCTPTSKRQTPSLLMMARSKMSSPPRSKLIQFGRDEDSEHRKFGARETYTYAFTCPNARNSKLSILSSKIQRSVLNLGDSFGLWDATSSTDGIDGLMGNDSCKVRYTRFGEGPVWYGPGKTCTLELWGEKVSSILSAPALASTLAATRMPGFMTVHTPLSIGPKGAKGTEKASNGSSARDDGKSIGDPKIINLQMGADRNAMQAVRWFRGKGEGSIPLTLLTDEDQDDKDYANGMARYRRMLDKGVNKGMTLVHKLRDSTILTSDAEKYFEP